MMQEDEKKILQELGLDAEDISNIDLTENNAAEENVKSRRFSFGKLGKKISASPFKNEIPAKLKDAANVLVKKSDNLPIAIFMGYLNGANKSDVIDYAKGIAERNCTDLSIVKFKTFEYETGFVYEIHEGGEGKAYFPWINQKIDMDGIPEIRIRTAKKNIMVKKFQDRGITCVQLPTGSEFQETPGPVGTEKMEAYYTTKREFFLFSLLTFFFAFLVLITAVILRPQLQAEVVPLAVDYAKETATKNLPLMELENIRSRIVMNDQQYLEYIRFKNGKWEHKIGDIRSLAATSGSDQQTFPAVNSGIAQPANPSVPPIKSGTAAQEVNKGNQGASITGSSLPKPVSSAAGPQTASPQGTTVNAADKKVFSPASPPASPDSMASPDSKAKVSSKDSKEPLGTKSPVSPVTGGTAVNPTTDQASK